MNSKYDCHNSNDPRGVDDVYVYADDHDCDDVRCDLGSYHRRNHSHSHSHTHNHNQGHGYDCVGVRDGDDGGGGGYGGAYVGDDGIHHYHGDDDDRVAG